MYQLDPSPEKPEQDVTPLPGTPLTGQPQRPTFYIAMSKPVASRVILGVLLAAFAVQVLYSIIRYGRGVMPRYGDKVRRDARWEIVNYVRQLQAAAVAVTPAAPGGAN